MNDRRDFIDQALIKNNVNKALVDGLDPKGFVAGWTIDSFANKQFSKLNPIVVTLTFFYNLFSGSVETHNENKKHEDDVKKTRKQK